MAVADVLDEPAAGAAAAVASDAARRFDLASYDMDAALALGRELGIGHVLAQVLVRRGLGDPAAARAFLGQYVTLP